MANPVQQLLAKLKNNATAGRQVAPTDPLAGLPPAPSRRPPLPGRVVPQATPQLKNASIVYGVGGLILYALAFYNLASAEWFNGLMLMLPATCLAYLAYRYMIQAE